MQKNKQVQHVTVDLSQSGRRIDNFLQNQLRGLPRTRIYQMIRKGEVRVNGCRVKQNHRVVIDDVVRIPPVSLSDAVKARPNFSRTVIEQLSSATLFEDDKLLIINKPSGLVVHAGSGQSAGVIEYLRHLRSELDFLELAHRLDRDTSGCLILTKTAVVLKQVQAAMSHKSSRKRYLTLVRGEWPEHLKQVSRPLKKNTLSSGERRVRVDPQGKEAITRFHRKRLYRCGSLLNVELLTGRTHQIRVHACAEGHPIAMDQKYGDKDYNKQLKRQGLKRLFLHASEIQLTLPCYAEPLTCQAPLADELQSFLSNL